MFGKCYVLLSTSCQDNTCCRGVYSSIDTLRVGVDQWIKKFPNQALSYEIWILNYPPEPTEWDWCYIPKDFESTTIRNTPDKSLWGTNITGYSTPE
jgi:hypothetical protein